MDLGVRRGFRFESLKKFEFQRIRMRHGGAALRRACVLAGRSQWRSCETAGNLIELRFRLRF
jgi:hypothetical protein